MIVVGIDPGIGLCGCAVVKHNGSGYQLLFCDAFSTPSTEILPARLSSLYQMVSDTLSRYTPDVVAIESLFFNTNAKTALVVGQARGVVQLAAFQKHIPIVEYTPLQVKMCLTGYGRADKKQIQTMTARLLQLKKIITPDDAADAAAIALTHCFSYKMKAQMQV